MTKGGNFNLNQPSQTILVAPLDWGLGHATRCIPIINEQLSAGNQVIIAAAGSSNQLLKEEFPQLEFVDIPGYDIQYSKSKFWLPFKIAGQLPGIFATIKAENEWLKKMVPEKNINVVIADNRPGLCHDKIKTIYITHQLCIKSKNGFLQKQMQRLHYKYINRFTECWVPDFEGKENLAGELSHPLKLPNIPVQYIGPQSRFEYKEEAIKYKLLMLLSGPEPQRTILENKLITQLSTFKEPVLFVRGVYDESKIPGFNNVNFVNHLSSVELNKAILQSEIIIARSGYSTIMDLVKLKKKAILIPTPGQTEQEYLAEYLNGKGLFTAFKQNEFSIKNF